MTSAYPNRNTWKLREGVCNRPRSSFVGEIGETDEELLSSEENVAAFQFGFRIGDLDQRQVELFLENRSDVFDLKRAEKTSIGKLHHKLAAAFGAKSESRRKATANLHLSEGQGLLSRSSGKRASPCGEPRVAQRIFFNVFANLLKVWNASKHN